MPRDDSALQPPDRGDAVGPPQSTQLTAQDTVAGHAVVIPSSSRTSSPRFRLAPGPRLFTPGSNPAEISGWLAKLLAGAGLVELTRLGGPLGVLADAVARGLGSAAPSGPAVVIAVAISSSRTVLVRAPGPARRSAAALTSATTGVGGSFPGHIVREQSRQG